MGKEFQFPFPQDFYGNPMGIPMGIPIWESYRNSHVEMLWEFPRGNPMGIPNPIGYLIRFTFDFEWLHNDAIIIYTFLCNHNIF